MNCTRILASLYYGLFEEIILSFLKKNVRVQFSNLKNNLMPAAGRARVRHDDAGDARAPRRRHRRASSRGERRRAPFFLLAALSRALDVRSYTFFGNILL